MRIRSLWLVLLVILPWSCDKEKDGFTVSGTIQNADGRIIYLSEMTSAELIRVDSSLVDTSGSFTLSSVSDAPKFYSVYIHPDANIYLIARTGDRITISGDSDNLPLTYSVDGSEDSRLIRELTREQNLTIERIQRLTKVFNENIQNPDFLEIKASLDSAFQGIVEAQRKFTFRFIENNLQSQASLMALYQQIGPRHYLLDPEQDFRYFAMVDSSLSILYPGSDAIGDLHRQVEELRQKKHMESMSEARLGIGVMAPDIALPSPEGDTILLSSLRGNIVLLDFWAAWCSPCRNENPNLVSNYKKYKDKGFKIYQVSLDRTKSAWVKGIQDDKLDWVHVSDLQYWNSLVVSVYNIQGIPMNYLLDREGKIMAHNLRGAQLGEKLEEIFNP